MKVHIEVDFKPLPRKRIYGDVEEVEAGHYKVTIDSRTGLKRQRKTWLHEVGVHIPFFLWGRTVDEAVEHAFINDLEIAYDKLWKKHMEGK